MNRRDVLAGGAGAAAALVTAQASAGESINAMRADAGLPPLKQEKAIMRGPAYEKDIFVVSTDRELTGKQVADIKAKTQKILGDDVLVVVLTQGLKLERITAIPGRFTS